MFHNLLLVTVSVENTKFQRLPAVTSQPLTAHLYLSAIIPENSNGKYPGNVIGLNLDQMNQSG
jgi:hypothetical protein